MIVYAPAKINIGLKVLNKRKDSYHNLDSIFYPIPLFDIIEVQPFKEFRLHVTGFKVDGDLSDNLVFKAWNLMRDNYGIDGIDVHLHKRIPMGAGLGGGSSDASSILKCINEVYDLGLKKFELESLASELGADCPFFIESVPVRARGVGNELNKIDLDLAGLYILLVKPDLHIATQDAYGNVSIEGENGVLYIDRIPSMGKWSSLFSNSFENHVFTQFPILDLIKKKMYERGAIYASMSGSGSTIYGLFKTKPSIPKDWSSFFVWQKQI